MSIACDGYFLIINTAVHTGSSVEVDDLYDHVNDCDECIIDFPNEDDAVVNAYLGLFDDTEFEEFADRFRGVFDSFEDFVEETLSEIYGEEYEDLIDKCNKMGLHAPETDMIAWGQDYDFDDKTGAVFSVA